MRALLITLLALCLSACASSASRLGFSETEWQTINKTKQQALLKQYQQIQEVMINESKNTVYAGPTILVWLTDGTAMMPPFIQAYAFFSAQFEIAPGNCQKINLISIDTKHRVKLMACYNGLTLTLDPSHIDPQKKDGSLRFDYNPIWKHGLTYNNVSSSGYVRLNQTNVTIKAIPKLKSHPQIEFKKIKTQKLQRIDVPQDDESAHI